MDFVWSDSLSAYAGKQILGICFGHQLMAHLRARSACTRRLGGWVHTSEIVERHSWMDAGVGDRFSLLSSHKDQVVSYPTVLRYSRPTTFVR